MNHLFNKAFLLSTISQKHFTKIRQNNIKKKNHLFQFNKSLSFFILISLLLCSTHISFAQYSPGKLAVLVVGDGSASLNNAATPVFIKEFELTGTLQNGTVKTSLPAIATTGTGVISRALTQTGTGTSEGFLNLSANGQYLTLTGYNSTAGFASVATSSATTFPTNTRVVGRIDATGNADTKTALYTAYTGQAIRSAVTVNGSGYWTAGSTGTVGVGYTTDGNPSPPLNLTGTNTRGIGIFNNQLYVSTGSGSIRLATVGNGLPTGGTQTLNNLNGFLTTTGDPYSYVFIDLDADGNPDVLYVASLSNAPTGLLKYTSNNGGNTWTSRGSLTGNAFGVTGAFNYCTGNVDLYITFNSTNAKPNLLYKFSDVAVTKANPANITFNGSAIGGAGTFLAIAATNTAFGGVAFTPGTSIINPTVFNVTGGGSYCEGGVGVAIGLDDSETGVSYQLYRDNVIVAGAIVAGTGSAISFGNQTVSGIYTVAVTNPLFGCVVNMNSNAVVTLMSIPIADAINNQTVCNGGNTATINFTANVPSKYNWTCSNPSIGLASFGTGNIPSFTAINNTGNPVTATITATPVFSGYAYLDGYNNTNYLISVIDRSTFNVVNTITLPQASSRWGISLTPNGNRFYVSGDGGGGNSMSLINTNTNSIISNFQVNYGGGYIMVSPDGTRLYSASRYSNKVLVINTATNVVDTMIEVGAFSSGLALSYDGSRLYFKEKFNNIISVINTTTNSIISQIHLSLGAAVDQGMVVSRDGSKLYVTNGTNNFIHIINTLTNTEISTINIGNSPWGLCISPDGSRIYTANISSNSVSVINTSTNLVIATIGVGTQPMGITVSPNGNQIYVANNGSSNVSVIDAVSNTVIATTSVGNYPISFGNFVSGTGCSGAPITFDITVNPTPLPPVISGNTIICNGQSTTLTASEGIAYLWSNGATTSTINVSPISNINYFVTVTYANGCSAISAPVTISFHPLPVIDEIISQMICAGNSTSAINFTGNIHAQYNWTNSNPSIGLATNGFGNIPSFIAINNGNFPISSTITATPVFSGYAYVANFSSNSVSVIDRRTNTVTDTISVGTNPYGIAVSKDGSRVYVTNDGSDNVSVINTVSKTVIATIGVGDFPRNICLSPDGSKGYVLNGNSNSLSVFNTTNNTIVATIPIEGTPRGIQISPDGSRVYVANDFAATISRIYVINTNTNSVVDSIPLANQPFEIKLSPDGSLLYAVLGYPNDLLVINTITKTIIANIGLMSQASGLEVNKDGSRLYITHSGSNLVSVINTTNNTLITTIGVGTIPFGISLSPEGDQMYVANFGSNNVSVIDIGSNTVSATIPVGIHPISFGNLISGTGCSGTPITFNIIVDPCDSNIDLNLKLYIQGFYSNGGEMTPVLFNTGLSLFDTDCDSINIELHDASSPSTIIAEKNAILLTDGNAVVHFPGMLKYKSYYVVIKHRNSIETWSKSPVIFSGTEISFDFSGNQ